MGVPSRPKRPTVGSGVPSAGGGGSVVDDFHVDNPDFLNGNMGGVVAPELAGMQVPSVPSASVVVEDIEDTSTVVKYRNAGAITSHHIISGEIENYPWLDEKVVEVTAWVQQALVAGERADDIERARMDASLRSEMAEEIDRLALQYLLKERKIRGDAGKMLIASVVNDIVGLGPIEPLWQDPTITEVIVNGPNDVYVEQAGRLIKAKACRFRSREHLLEVCQRILVPLNRKVDVRDPLADGRLPDGSRVNVVHNSLAPKGPLLTIRRFPESNRSLIDLVEIGSLEKDMAVLIANLIANKSSTLVVGGTGSGKALDVDTLVPVPGVEGADRVFTRMGDLQVGDVVFDERGKPTRVTGAYDVMLDHPCYEVVFEDGSRIVADEEHLWTVWVGEKTVVGSRSSSASAIARTLTTGKLVELLDYQASAGNSRNVFVRGGFDGVREERFVTGVFRVVSRPVRCIKVEADSSLFLVGELGIPTHNTTLLNALSAVIPRHERIVTIEDSLELRLDPNSHVAAMEGRPPDATGQNAVTIRQLVKNALRMRPDRIIVGEIRDSAALDMLQACNTGHEGSMSTVHANGPDEAISRLTVMVAQGGEIPADKVEWLVGSAIDIIVMARRFEDGSRRVSGIYEVPDVSQIRPGESLRTIPLWVWEQTGTAADGKLIGEYRKYNDISEHLVRTKKMDHGVNYDWDSLSSLLRPSAVEGGVVA